MKTEKARDGLTEKALCKAWKNVRQRALWIYGGGNFKEGSNHKGPEMRICLMCWGNCKEASGGSENGGE